MFKKFVTSLLFGAVSFSCFAGPTLPLVYPLARKESVSEKKFGIKLEQPYQWMENIFDPELDPWVKAQNTLADAYLAGDTRAQVEQEVKEYLAATLKKESISQKEFLQNQEQQEYEMSRRRFVPAGAGFSAGEEESPSGKYTILMQSDSNRDLVYLKIKEVSSGLFIKDSIMVKFASVFWESDESFVYAAEPDGRLGSNRSQIRRHILGQTQANDAILFEAEKSLQNISLYRLDDKSASGRYLLIEEDNTDGTRVSLSWFDAKSGAKTNIKAGIKGSLNLIGSRAQQIYFTSFYEAPFGQINAVDLETGALQSVFKSEKYAIDVALMSSNAVYLTQINESVMHILSVLNFAESGLETPKVVPLPFEANVEMSLDDKDNLNLILQSYSRPATGWSLQSDSLTVVKTTKAKPTQIDLVSRRVFYTAPNGLKAPIWLVYKKGVELNANTATLLYGYGGFSVNILPRYAARESRISFFKRGGVMAFVTLPGGLEFGETWHQLGNLLNKRNVFDAFAAAGQQLIRFGFTSPAKLACNGGSNGGTLVGSTINKYPELFKAAIPQVGVMDMDRFAQFTAGKFWVSEYGDSTKKTDFYNLLSYSPLHNIKAQKYPATLVMTGSDDDRVVPMHTYKYAARLQEVGSKETPLLLHTDVGGSHGRSATESEKVRKATNFATFLIRELGME